MKKIVSSLPFRLLLGVVIGIIAGQFFGTALMNVVVTVKFVLGEFKMCIRDRSSPLLQNSFTGIS